MKQKETGYKIYGLRAKFLISLLISLVASGIIFFILYNVMDDMLVWHDQQIDNDELRINKQFDSLQSFIDENEISSYDIRKIKKWESSRPVSLLEIYSDNDCIYSSIEYDPEFSIERHNNQKRINTEVIHLRDIDAEADLYIDFTYQYYLLSITLSAAISVLIFIALFMVTTLDLVRYVRRLNDEIHILEGGNLDYYVTVKGNDEVTDLAVSMNNMREAVKEQMETERRLNDASRQMVTEMSHDLRTPITGIMLYTEILKSGRYSSEEELRAYLDKIDAKAYQMKELSDRLLEYNLEGVSEKFTENKSMRQAFGQIVKAFKEEMKLHGFNVISEGEWAPCSIRVNDEYIRRIFDNAASNIYKYADPSFNVYLEVENSDKYCGLTFINTCRRNYDNSDSKGVGIKSIQSMMKEMKGVCTVEQSGEEFKISIMFPTI